MRVLYEIVIVDVQAAEPITEGEDSAVCRIADKSRMTDVKAGGYRVIAEFLVKRVDKIGKGSARAVLEQYKLQ